jgi:hypothetical protein
MVLLTGENLLPKLRSHEEVFGDQLSELLVFMPEEIGYSKALNPEQYTDEYYNSLKQEWLKTLRKLKNERERVSVKLGFFTEPPYFGASYLNWRRTEGRIHISPYVWGTGTSINPAFDVEWVGKNMPPVYKSYVEGLKALNISTKNELDTPTSD